MGALQTAQRRKALVAAARIMAAAGFAMLFMFCAGMTSELPYQCWSGPREEYTFIRNRVLVGTCISLELLSAIVLGLFVGATTIAVYRLVAPRAYEPKGRQVDGPPNAQVERLGGGSVGRD